MDKRLLTAGKELLKGNFSTAVKSFSDPIEIANFTPANYRTMSGPVNYFFGNDGRDYPFRFTDMESGKKAYERCPTVTAVINRKAKAYINGKTWVMNTQGKESNTPVAKKIRALLEKPNPLQSWKQFEAQQQIYINLFGFCILLPIIPAGFEEFGASEATALWNIPPYMVSVEETNKLWYQTDMQGIIKEIKLNYKGIESTLDVNSIYIFKDITPSFCSMIFPDSRVRSLQQPISNIIGAYESRGELIDYAGAQGIFTAEKDQYGSVVVGQEDKDLLQKDYRKYGVKKGQWRHIITAAAIKWEQVGRPTRDLQLIEEVEESSIAICNGFDFPPFMLGLRDTTFNNQNTAEKSLYQNTVIPESMSCYEQWNHVFKTADHNITIIKDYDHLPVLQEDKSQLATARKTMDDALSIEFEKGLITLNDWLIELGKDPLPAELGNVRATDPKTSNVPLAVTIGVGGVQGLVTVLAAQGVADDAKQAILEVVFGISPTDAARMAVSTQTENNEPATTEEA